MKIRVGVAGVGHRGLGLTRILAAMEDVALVALADLDAPRLQRAAREFKVDRTFAYLGQMLDRCRPDPDAGPGPPSANPQKPGSRGTRPGGKTARLYGGGN